MNTTGTYHPKCECLDDVRTWYQVWYQPVAGTQER